MRYWDDVFYHLFGLYFYILVTIKATMMPNGTSLQNELFQSVMDNSLKDVEKWLLQGADPDQANIDGVTPLIVAAQNGHWEVVKALLEKEANPNQADKKGYTPLFRAAQSGHLEVVKALLDKGAEADKANNDDITPLMIAAQNGHLEVVKALLEIRAKPNPDSSTGLSPLFLAAKNGHWEVVKALLEKQADPNQVNKDNVSPLCIAALDGNVAIVKALLETGANPNQATSTGFSPLFLAAKNGHWEIVEALLEKGAETDKAKQIAIKKEMDISIFSSWSLNRLPISHKNLIKCGSKLGYSLNSEGICQGSTMRWIEATILGEQTRFIERAKKIKELNELLEPDGDEKLEDLQKKEGWKDILWDIKAFYESLYLYQDPNKSSDILGKRVNQADIDLISKIAASDRIQEKGLKSSSILRYDEFSTMGLQRTLSELKEKIIASKYQQPVCFLLECVNKSYNHAINVTYNPIENTWQWMDINEGLIKSEDLTNFFEKNKFYLDSYDIFAISAVLPITGTQQLESSLSQINKEPLNQEPQINQLILTNTSKRGDLEMVKALLEKGANPNQANNDGVTPLIVAAHNGHWDVVKALLEKGANPNQAKNDGITPLFRAAQNDHWEVVKALLEKGADPNQADNDGITPLLIAAQNGYSEVVKALLEKGAKPNQANSKGFSPLRLAARYGHLAVVEALLEKGANPNQANNDGFTPLFVAARYGHLEVVEALLKKGANPNQADNDGDTPLFIAVLHKNLDIVKALLENKADPNQAANIDGYTPLLVATVNGHWEVVKALLEKGANPNQVHSNGYTPLDFAKIKIESIMHEIQEKITQKQSELECKLKTMQEQVEAKLKDTNNQINDTLEKINQLQSNSSPSTEKDINSHIKELSAMPELIQSAEAILQQASSMGIDLGSNPMPNLVTLKAKNENLMQWLKNSKDKKATEMITHLMITIINQSAKTPNEKMKELLVLYQAIELHDGLRAERGFFRVFGSTGNTKSFQRVTKEIKDVVLNLLEPTPQSTFSKEEIENVKRVLNSARSRLPTLATASSHSRDLTTHIEQFKEFKQKFVNKGQDAAPNGTLAAEEAPYVSIDVASDLKKP